MTAAKVSRNQTFCCFVKALWLHTWIVMASMMSSVRIVMPV